MELFDTLAIWYGFIIVAAGGSFYLGHKRGIVDAVEQLEALGLIELEDTNQK